MPATRLGGQQGRGKGEGGGDGRAGPRLVAGAALTAVGVRVAEDQEEQRKSEKR